MHRAFEARKDDDELARLRGEVAEFCAQFPVPGVGA